ncbi:MAG TPA: ROK family protein [Tepidisphaeraceae bacterium]|nr:ROK family protein [Tepidisphaeraceae bacterium]
MMTLGIDIGGSSIKLATIHQGEVLWKEQSATYSDPAPNQLISVLQQVLEPHKGDFDAIGLCVPGIVDPKRCKITLSVNLPKLAGVSLDDLIARAIGKPARQTKIFNDTVAAAADLIVAKKLTSRVLVLAIGTGVGAAVMDEGKPLETEPGSPGHIGQIDVSLGDHPPIGPDNGAGSLEAYLGAPALIRAYGSMESFFQNVKVSDDPIRALIRAVRICHAIYRPQHVILAGGIGLRLKHLSSELQNRINENLTKVALKNWTLSTAEHDFHAAIGAARMA